jgi:hypothetical protein
MVDDAPEQQQGIGFATFSASRSGRATPSHRLTGARLPNDSRRAPNFGSQAASTYQGPSCLGRLDGVRATRDQAWLPFFPEWRARRPETSSNEGERHDTGDEQLASSVRRLYGQSLTSFYAAS